MNKVFRSYQFPALLLAVLGCLVGFVGCSNSNILFEDNATIPKQQWFYDTIPSFSFKIEDSQKKYDVVINFRHNKTYRFSNVFVLLHEQGPSMRDTAYRHELKLAELDGRWLGRASGGLYHNELLVKEDFQFPDTGQYTFAIEQNMRVNPLTGVNDVGFKVVEKK